MICRNCGIEIADKALICYRCGTATTEAKFKAPVARQSSAMRVAGILVILVLIAAALSVDRVLTASSDGSTRLVPWLLVAIAVIIVALRAFLRRR